MTNRLLFLQRYTKKSRFPVKLRNFEEQDEKVAIYMTDKQDQQEDLTIFADALPLPAPGTRDKDMTYGDRKRH